MVVSVDKWNVCVSFAGKFSRLGIEYRAVVDEVNSVVKLYQHHHVVANIPCVLQADTWRRLLIDSEDYAFSLWQTNGHWKMSLYRADEDGFIQLNGEVTIPVESTRSQKPRPIL